MAERRPLHETLVDVIRGVEASEELDCLARFIKATKIPKNQDAIIIAWKEKLEEFAFDDENNCFGVVACLEEQKREAEAEAAAKRAKADGGGNPTKGT